MRKQSGRWGLTKKRPGNRIETGPMMYIGSQPKGRTRTPAYSISEDALGAARPAAAGYGWNELPPTR
jgi:hypothetical protein